MTPNNASGLADTFGWDTVFGIRFADVNAAIAAKGKTPPSFSGSLSDDTMTVKVDGTFAAWQIAAGGDGKDVHLSLPMPIVHYDDGKGPQTFDDATAIIEVQLTMLPRPDAGGDGTWMDLTLGSSAGAAASVLTLTFKGKNQPTGFTPGIVQTVLESWLNAHLQAFNHVFASVNLNARAAVGGLQWLMPTDVSYAVVDRGSAETSVFAVLCMTEHRDASKLPHQASPFVIPDGQRSGLLISQERFLSKLLLPGIGSMFSGPVTPVVGKKWPKDYFQVDGDGQTIVNLADIKIDNFQLDDVSYVADLKKGNLEVRLQTTWLETQFIDLHHQLDLQGELDAQKVTIPIGWLDVYHTINNRATARLTGQVFDLLPMDVQQHTVVSETATAQKIELGLLIASLAASLVGMTAYFATRGVATMAAPAIDSAAAAVDATATVVAVPTAADSAAMAADGAPVVTSALRGAVVNAQKFLVAWNVASRAGIISSVTGAVWAIEAILATLSDIHYKDAPPDFQPFVDHMMGPVKWPAQKSQFTLNTVAINGAFQITGDPGFAN